MPYGMTEEEEAQFLLDNLTAYARPVQDVLDRQDAAATRAPDYRDPLAPTEAESEGADAFPLSPIDYTGEQRAEADAITGASRRRRDAEVERAFTEFGEATPTEPVDTWAPRRYLPEERATLQAQDIDRLARARDIQRQESEARHRARTEAALARGEAHTQRLAEQGRAARTLRNGGSVMAGAMNLFDLPRGMTTQVWPEVVGGAARLMGAEEGAADDLAARTAEFGEPIARAWDSASEFVRRPDVQRTMRGPEGMPATNPIDVAWDLATAPATSEGRLGSAGQGLMLGRVDEILSGYGMDIDRVRENLARAEEDEVGYGQGSVASLIPWMAAPGARSIPFLARMGGFGGVAARAAAGTGEAGVMGFAAGTGDSEAEAFTPEWLSAGAEQAGPSAAIGALFQVPSLIAGGYRAIADRAPNAPGRIARTLASAQEIARLAPEGTRGDVARLLDTNNPPPAAPTTRAPTGYRDQATAARGRPAPPSLDEVVQASERRISGLTPAELRAAAMRGGDRGQRERLIGEIADSLDNLFRRGSEVEESVGRLQVKAPTIQRAMEAAPAAANAPAQALALADEVIDQVRGYSAGNNRAISNAMNAEMQRLREQIEFASESGNATEAFMALDELKRAFGRLQSAVQRGDLGSVAFAEDVRSQYARMQRMLEDANVWGAEASRIQREANAAFTDMIPRRSALQRFMGENPDERDASGWAQGRRANRRRVAQVLSESNQQVGLDDRADLLRGARSFGDWAEVQQRLYAGSTEAAREMQREARRLIALMDTVQTDSRASRLLEETAASIAGGGVERAGTLLPWAVRILHDIDRGALSPRQMAERTPLMRALGETLQRIGTRGPALEAASDRGESTTRVEIDEDYLRSLGMEPEPSIDDEYLRSLGMEPEEGTQ
jgi:hypothetical protein